MGRYSHAETRKYRLIYYPRQHNYMAINLKAYEIWHTGSWQKLYGPCMIILPGVYHIMRRIIVGELIDKYKYCEMLWVLSNHERAWLTHQCTLGGEIARLNIFLFKVIKILIQVQMFLILLNCNKNNSFNHSLSLKSENITWYYMIPLVILIKKNIKIIKDCFLL